MTGHSGAGKSWPTPGKVTSRAPGMARQARRIYQRYPWLIDLPAVGALPGPNAIAYTEQVLAVLDITGLDHRARLETVGIFTGLVSLLAPPGSQPLDQ